MKTTTTLKTALVIIAATIINLSASAKSTVNPSPSQQAAFSATFNDIKADLKWTAGADENISHFVVERSIDGINFQDAAVVFAFETGSNNFTYKFSEKLNNTDGVVYYRLCTIDKNGNYSYSTVQTVHTPK